MLTVNDLKYSVGNYKILNGVSFNVKDKEFVGIMGPNGSGKSNISDAIRWVLGETSSKQLRGPTAAR